MDETNEPKKGSGKLIPIAVAIGAMLGSTAFAFLYSAGVKKNEPAPESVLEEEIEETQKLDFLELEPLLISLGSAASGKQLRFEGYLEINPLRRDDIVLMMPRIMDVLNTYLRAVEYSDIEEPASLLKLRLQMLKRVQIVLGEDVVYDLLVSKFLIS